MNNIKVETVEKLPKFFDLTTVYLVQGPGGRKWLEKNSWQNGIDTVLIITPVKNEFKGNLRISNNNLISSSTKLQSGVDKVVIIVQLWRSECSMTSELYLLK